MNTEEALSAEVVRKLQVWNTAVMLLQEINDMYISVLPMPNAQLPMQHAMSDGSDYNQTWLKTISQSI